jgi:hypothetical protein
MQKVDKKGQNILTTHYTENQKCANANTRGKEAKT